MLRVNKFALAGCVLVIVGGAAIGAPTVTMTLTRNVNRTQVQGSGTYDVFDFFYSSSPGEQFTNYNVTGTATTGSFADPARLQDDRQINPASATQNGGTAGAVDMWANTVWSSAGKVDNGLTATILADPAGYAPAGSGASPAFTSFKWDVFDNVLGDDNDLSNDPDNPIAATAPYHIMRVVTSPNATGTIDFLAFDTANPGIATPFSFNFAPGNMPPQIVNYLVGPTYNNNEPGEPQTLTHQFQVIDSETPAGPFAWDMLTLQSYTPNYGAENFVPLAAGPHFAPTLSPEGLFSWISELSPSGDYIWQVRVSDPEGLSDFGTITINSTQGGLVGDYNRDEVVDAADCVVWRKNVGDVVPRCTGGDANCNTFVENLDILPWKAHYGETLTAVSASSMNSNIPEPSCLVLLAAAFVVSSSNRFRCDRSVH